MLNIYGLVFLERNESDAGNITRNRGDLYLKNIPMIIIYFRKCYESMRSENRISESASIQLLLTRCHDMLRREYMNIIEENPLPEYEIPIQNNLANTIRTRDD